MRRYAAGKPHGRGATLALCACSAAVVIAANGAQTLPLCSLYRSLEKRIYIPLPEPKDIRALLEINLKSLPLEPDVDLEALSAKMGDGGFSGADITNLCRDAAMMPMRRRIKVCAGTLTGASWSSPVPRPLATLTTARAHL